MANPKGNLMGSFNKLKNFMFFNHGGILVEKCPEGFKWCGRVFATIEVLDAFRNEPTNVRVITSSDGCAHSDEMINE